MGVSSCCTTMCVINSFFGIPLQTAVKWIGIVKLVITLILAIICIVGQTQVTCMDDEGNFLDGGSIECVGPYIRQICFDFFLPMTCALLLIFGARQKSSCLLLTWFIIVFCCYVQYLWVVFASDWDRAGDWVAICYVVHYTAVAIVVYSFMKAAKRNEGVVHNNIIKTEEGQAAAAAVPAEGPLRPEHGRLCSSSTAWISWSSSSVCSTGPIRCTEYYISQHLLIDSI